MCSGATVGDATSVIRVDGMKLNLREEEYIIVVAVQCCHFERSDLWGSQKRTIWGQVLLCQQSIDTTK
jgi:hypothetical protein